MAISLPDAKAVAYLYEAALGRPADLAGLNFWIGILDSGVYTLHEIARDFLASVEFEQDFGDPADLSDEAFVETLYQNILGRAGDEAGRDFWVAVLGGGFARADLLNAFAVSDENREGSTYVESLTLGDTGQYVFGTGPVDGPGPVDVGAFEVTANAALIGLDDLWNDPRFAGIDGRGYTTVIIDSGIDLDNPAFGPDLDGNGVADRIVYSEDLTLEGDGTVQDRSGHGTLVASAFGSADPDHPGIAPGANIILLQVLDVYGNGLTRWVEEALQWAEANAEAYNIVSVNMSFSDSRNVNEETPFAPRLADEFAALEEAGIVTVAAAGNSYYAYAQPGVSGYAADPHVIPVGAVWSGDFGTQHFADGSDEITTGADRIAVFSQRSTDVPMIFAPGGVFEGAGLDGSTDTMIGTSSAAPHVAAAVVLAQQIAELELGRRLTPAEFRTLLFDTGETIFDGDDEDDNVANTNTSYKRLDMHALAEAILDLGATASMASVEPAAVDAAHDALHDLALDDGAFAASLAGIEPQDDILAFI